MRVSVVVPVYNHEPFVEATIRSVAEQDWPDVELVLIDDGSGDGSAARVRAALDVYGARFSRVVFEQQTNRGIVPTLNRLVGLSTGAFVLPLASDDWLLPGAIRHRVGELVRHPNALAVFTDCMVVDEDDRPLHESGIRDLHGGDLGVLASNRMMAASLILQWCVPGPCMLARREAYDPVHGVGPYDAGLAFEDFSFYLRLAGAGRLRFSPHTTAAYRQRVTGASYALGITWDDMYVETLKRCLPYLRGAARALARSVLEQRRLKAAVTDRLDPRRLFWAAVRRGVEALHRRATGPVRASTALARPPA